MARAHEGCGEDDGLAAAVAAAELLDLDRYPALVAEAPACQANLTAHGICVLPGLARAEGVAALLEHVQSRPVALSDKYHTVTQLPVDPALPAEHPRNRLVHARIGFVGRRALGAHSPLAALYAWPPLLEFVRAATNSTLFLSADVDGSVYATVNRDGYLTAWHIDQHPVSAVLLLQKAEQGGQFLWVHGLVDQGDDAMYRELPGILDGTSSLIQSIATEPGTLVLFRGANTLHQVAPVHGAQARVSVVFAFAPTPDFGNSELVKAANKWEPE